MIPLIDDLLLGLLVGLMSSILGLGGGIVMVPALVLLLAFSQQAAVGTSLLAISFVSTFNVVRFQLKKLLDWKTALKIGLTGGILSFLSGSIASCLSQQVLLVFFILVLIYLIFKTLRAQDTVKQSITTTTSESSVLKAGALAGIISGLTGVGGGSILTPILLAKQDIKKKMVVPLSNAFMMITAIGASIGYAMHGPISWQAWEVGALHVDTALLIFSGAMPASAFGTYFQSKVSLKARKIALLFFLILILIKMLLRLGGKLGML